MFYVMFRGILLYFFFFFNDTATTEIYTLSLHDALPICIDSLRYFWSERTPKGFATDLQKIIDHYRQQWHRDKVMLIGDRKSTRLNSSHSQISYAVFCLKKKNIYHTITESSCFHGLQGHI